MTKLIAWGQRVDVRPQPKPPGNSLGIIDAAYKLGYDGVELDVQLSRDKVFVLIHDHILDSTTNLKGPVGGLTAAELKGVALKDAWNGPPAFIESLESALRLNGDRGYVMVDSYHTNRDTVSALQNAVISARFNEDLLLLLTHSREGGLQLKQAFPHATVMLKAMHTMFPPNLTTTFVDQAEGLDCVLCPIADYPDALLEFRKATHRRKLKLAVYMHHGDVGQLAGLMQLGVDFVTSDGPASFADARQAAKVL